jgi:hypothetical protein
MDASASGMRAAVVDEPIVQLLHDCDTYLTRQRALLLQAAVLGFPDNPAAMNSALDQLAAGVACAWRAVLSEPAPDPDPRAHPQGHSGRSPSEPGE